MFGFKNPHDKPEPLDYGFNVATMTRANSMNPAGWLTTDSYHAAPVDLQSMNRTVADTGRLVIWTGGSDQTIYGCPEHNIAARAWHDAVHYRTQLPTTLAGEAGVCYVQCWQLLQEYGNDDEVRSWIELLLTEVIGQALEFAQTGEFPKDQRGFTEFERGTWSKLAARIVLELGDDDATEADAIKLAAETWGKA